MSGFDNKENLMLNRDRSYQQSQYVNVNQMQYGNYDNRIATGFGGPPGNGAYYQGTYGQPAGFNDGPMQIQPQEKHMYALVQHFQGDDQVIEEIYKEAERDSKTGRVYIDDYALKLSEEGPPISLYEIRDVLKQFGSMPNNTEVDLIKFRHHFTRIFNQQLGPNQANTDVWRQQNDNRFSSNFGASNNPMMPGYSSTQTRCNIGQYGTSKLQQPRNYQMSKECDSKMFEDIMVSCYLMDILVEDEFEKYARIQKENQKDQDKRKPQPSKKLQREDLEEAIKKLGIEWNNKDTFRVFTWIFDAFNDSKSKNKSQIQAITAEQIDQSVHWEVKNTIEQLQDEIMDRYNKLNINSKAEFKKQLVSQKDKSGKGGLSLQEVWRVQEEYLKKMRLKEKDVFLLFKKYEQNGQIVIERFLSDLMMGQQQNDGWAKNTIDGLGGTGFDQLKRLKDLQMMLSPYIKEFSEQFSNKESYRSGMISQNEFIAQVQKYENTISLQDQDALCNRYLKGNEIDYREFLDDLKKFKKEDKDDTGFKNLTIDQEELMKNCRDWILKDESRLIKIASSAKTIDKNKKGYLSSQEIHQILKDNQLKLGETQMKILESILPLSQNGNLLSLKDLFIFLSNKDKGEMLFKATINDLRDGKWDTKKKQSETKFKVPQQVVQPFSAIMGNIGRKIIEKGMNYELILSQRIQYSQPNNPEILLQELRKKFTYDFDDIRLSAQEEAELREYFRNTQSNKGTVQVVTLLKDFGLPPQTIGIAKKTKGPQKLLDRKELEECHKIMMKIVNEFKKQRKIIKESFDKYFPAGSVTIREDDFVEWIQGELCDGNRNFLNEIGLTRHLPNLVLYLADSDPSKISVDRVKLAFTYRDSDAPMEQQNVEDLKRYMTGLEQQIIQSKESTVASPEVKDLTQFLIKNKIDVEKLFGKPQKDITVQQFEKFLSSNKYQSAKLDKLIDQLSSQKGFVSAEKVLNALQTNQPKKLSQQQVKNRISTLPLEIQKYLQKIEEYMNLEKLSVKELHKRLDIDGDGNVTKAEFVQRMRQLRVVDIDSKNYGLLFDALDINGDGELSVGEFGMYLTGIKQKQEDIIKNMDRETVMEMKANIQELFEFFDSDRNGSVDADEIFKTFQLINLRKSMEECKEIIRQGGGVDGLTLAQFMNVMLPMMQKEMINKEDQFHDLRQKFMEADVDYNGFLTIDEFYNCLRSMGADVSVQEVVNLMAQLDIDGDSKLDIDEFLSLMSVGEKVNFGNDEANQTIAKIHKVRKLNPTDLLKFMSGMPTNFVPSLIEENWSKQRNLPSSVFKPQIDPRTMLWKDCIELRSEDVKLADKKRGFRPKAQPQETYIGCQITLDEAIGVTLPKEKEGEDGVKLKDIIKRSVRIAIERSTFEGRHREIVCNSIQVPAYFNQNQAEDIWKFDKEAGKFLNSIIFRTTKSDRLDEGRLIFELVCSIKKDNKIVDMSCGWSEVDIRDLQIKSSETFKLEIKGGSPGSAVDIKDEDVRNNRSGFAFLKKAVQTGIQKRLDVKITSFTTFNVELKDHLSMMPSTCLFHKELIYFLSGYMNYRNNTILKENISQQFVKPSGDLILSAFPKIYDNPDIVEELAQVWVEDVVPQITKAKMLDVDYHIQLSKDYISRLYTILYTDEFKQIQFGGTTKSAIHDQKLYEKRKKLIQSALRYKQSFKTKNVANEAVHDLTTFKPFSIRELEYNIWDDTKPNTDKFVRLFEQKGIICCDDHKPHNDNNHQAAQGAHQNEFGNKKVRFQY